MPSAPHRVVFLNLAHIRLPVGALTSILHRVSGVLLALAIPAIAWALDRSLDGAEGFADVASWLAHPAIAAALVVWTWALAHHLLAGVRHLLTDIDVGSRLYYARKSAYAVNVAAAVIALAAAGVLL